MYTVYKHTTPSGKVYIGITKKKPEYRWKNGNGYKDNAHFDNAIKKYGWENIEHEIVENGLTKQQACNLEIKLIAKYDATDPRYGYNISIGGECSALGMHHSIEARRKMSESRKGKPSTFKGKHHSAETRRKISEAGKRAYLNNPELRRKTSEANKKRHISPETRRKISEANKGKHISPETRLKLSEAKKGQTPWNKGKKGVQHISSETRRKMSESHEGTSLSPETRKKMSESIKRAYLNPELRLKISEARKKSVICVETGTLYSSVTEAAESIGVTGGAISGVLRGAHKTSGGYHWKYVD